MKKLIFIASFLLLTAVFIAPLSVSAAESPSIKPGSFFYGFVTTFEKINLFFTFNQEKKAEKALKYADKRLAEAEAVAGDKNSDAVKAAISGYEENIALAAEASKKVKDETKAENLLNLIADNASKHQQVLSDVLSKVPDEAKGAITKAIEASQKGQEEAIKQIAELKQEAAGLKQEITELKKQQGKEPAVSQNIGAESQPASIKELKKEIEGLKKQATTPEVKTQTTIQASTKKTEIKEELQDVTLTNSLGISYTFADPTERENQQRIRDLLDIGFVVTRGKLPEGISIKQNETPAPTSTPVSIEPLKIISVNISSTFNTMTFEWMTNKLTQSKIFLSGSNLSSMVYQSESGLSTRHIVHIFNLSGNTNYSYEIEAVAGEEIVKKQGSFSTKQVKEGAEIKITSDGGQSCDVNTNGRYCRIEVYYFENYQRVNIDLITISSDDNGIFNSDTYNGRTGTNGNPATGFTRPGGDGPIAYFTYMPSATNTRTLTATANGVIATLKVSGQVEECANKVLTPCFQISQ